MRAALEAAGQSNAQANSWGDSWARQKAMAAAQDAGHAAAIASANTKWITIGRYGAGADPILDGGGTAPSAIYIKRNGMGGWHVSNLQLKNFTASGIFFSNNTTGPLPFTTDDYHGTARGMWVHDCTFDNVAIGVTPNADPNVTLAGHDFFVGCAIEVAGLDYLRVERVTITNCDSPYRILTGKQWRFDTFTVADIKWQHADWGLYRYASLTNATFDRICTLGYHAGSAGLLLAMFRDVLVQNVTINSVPRPNPNGATGSGKTPDGNAVDLDFGGTEILFDQCSFNDNAAGIVEYLAFTAPTATTVPATFPRTMWTRNSGVNNGVDNADRANNAGAFCVADPVQGIALWWNNDVDLTSPGTNLWFQQGQTVGDVPGTSVGAPWVVVGNNIH